MNMVLAAFYEAWKVEHERVAETERVRRLHGLIAAYHCLLGDAEGLDRGAWDALATALRPRASAADRGLMFAALEPVDGRVALADFVVKCPAALDADLREARRGAVSLPALIRRRVVTHLHTRLRCI